MVETTRPRGSLSLREARALALRAQGFGARARKPIDLLDRLGAIQLDSVNVVARSHELVPMSRLGPTSIVAMRDAIYKKKRGFEYWGHAASWLPMADFRYFLPRKARMRVSTRGWWRSTRDEHAMLYQHVLERIRAEGPLTSAAFEDPREKRGTWWDWKPAKRVLEDLFDMGELMATDRTRGFARLYDLPERVLPPGIDTTDPGIPAAARYLMRRAIAALGVADASQAADYFRLRPDEQWRPALAEIVEAGEVVPIAVEGWRALAYATPEALAGPLRVPRHRPAFLTPFDNLIWERKRTECLFGFAFQLEIYVPEQLRKYGYYVLPLLANGTLVGRADIKLERTHGTLRVRALYLEGGAPEDAAAALRDLASHLGATSIVVDRVEPATWCDEVVRLVANVDAPTAEPIDTTIALSER